MRSFVFLLIFFTMFLLAEEKPQPAGAEILAQQIEKLDSNNYDERDKATRILMDAGPQAIELLRQALKTERSAEFVLRANRIVRFFEGGGEPVNGLKLTLSTNQKTVKHGDSITLTTRLANTGNIPLKVCVGYSVDGEEHNDFLEGRSLRSLLWIEDWGRSGPGVIELLPRMLADPFRGHIKMTPPVYVVIPAKGEQTYTTKLQFSHDIRAKDDTPYPHLAQYDIGEHHFLAIPVTPKGTHRLGMTLKWDLKDHEHSGGAPGEIQPKANEFKAWSDSVSSNEIEIKVSE